MNLKCSSFFAVPASAISSAAAVFLALGSVSVPLSAEGLSIDFQTSVGPIKPVNAVGQPPLIGMDNVSMFHYLTEAGVGYSRLHDVGGAFGKNVFVDIPNVFRDFGADENDPANYDFAFTDMLITNLVAAGVQPFYRLGVTIENAAPRVKAYRIVPPKDYAKWARICEHVVAHYNEGWADGFRLGITYWEIWNEADDSADYRKSFMWQAPFEEYIRLYGVTATHLKRRFPDIKICGYGSCGYYGANHATVWGEECVDRVRHFMTCTSNFLQTVKREGWPLDMFTYHAYDRVEYCRGQAEYIRKTLDDFGFMHVKVNLDEWLCYSSQIGTAKQATGIAAILAELQNGPVDMAMIYDARCGMAYSPLFDGLTKRPYKAYWAFVAFNELKKLGFAAKRAGKLPENVWATAATDGQANGAILMANTSGERVDVPLDLGGWKIVSAKLSDRLSDYRPYDFAGVLPPESFVLIKCEKDR